MLQVRERLGANELREQLVSDDVEDYLTLRKACSNVPRCILHAELFPFPESAASSRLLVWQVRHWDTVREVFAERLPHGADVEGRAPQSI